jgi:endonuclease YncB( thermonuclease family)
VVSERPDLPLRRPQDLTLDTYRLVEGSEVKPPDGYVLVDLGFYVYFPVANEALKTITITEKPAYAYPAYIERVVDGDTLIAEIEIGFGVVVRERLRLRGIDAPEIGSAEGDRSKRFLEDLLRPGTRIVVRSYSTDIYGRFVADIFFRVGIADPKVIVRDGIFVNQDLLDRGLAVRMV